MIIAVYCSAKDTIPERYKCIGAQLGEWIASKGYGIGKVMNALRVTLVGAAVGPHIFEITDFIGKEETLARARKAISTLS